MLKFVNWKIRLLSLDTVGSNIQKHEVAAPEYFLFASTGQEPIADLERMEPSAVIQLALAKLSAI